MSTFSLKNATPKHTIDCLVESRILNILQAEAESYDSITDDQPRTWFVPDKHVQIEVFLTLFVNSSPQVHFTVSWTFWRRLQKHGTDSVLQRWRAQGMAEVYTVSENGSAELQRLANVRQESQGDFAHYHSPVTVTV